MRNIDTGDLTVFNADCWFSATKNDKKICRDLVAMVKRKPQLHGELLCLGFETNAVVQKIN